MLAIAVDMFWFLKGDKKLYRAIDVYLIRDSEFGPLSPSPLRERAGDK